jgi:Cdc6-like AAA superfamily ATPase
MNEMRSDVQDAKNAVKDLGFEQKREKIKRWLSSSDPSTNYNKALQQRQKGSGRWFLQIEAFAKWKKRQNSFLWLSGIPGSGKTILSSTIIEDLEKTLQCQSLLYFYFDFSDTDKQTLESMVRSLMSQLYSKCGGVSKELDDLFSSCGDGHQKPSCELFCKAFLHMMEQVKEVWIILDALDECCTRKGPPTEGLLSWMREVLNSEQRSVHLLVTSRPEQDIKSVVSEFAFKDDMVNIQSDFITNDIREYVQTRVKQHEGFKRWRSQPEVQDEIETVLMEKVDGM